MSIHVKCAGCGTELVIAELAIDELVDTTAKHKDKFLLCATHSPGKVLVHITMAVIRPAHAGLLGGSLSASP